MLSHDVTGDASSGSDFWELRRDINVRAALPYQWEMYERVGTIDNFRVAAGLKSASRRGYFYTDSDLHKWADAACRSVADGGADALLPRIDEYVDLMRAAQTPDGYLYTYNQIDFPDRRWENLLIEHELYCHGHFIEAGVEYAQAFGSRAGGLLELSLRSADLICREFGEPGDRRVPGHQEIEIALLRLHRITGERRYLETATAFLQNRGRSALPGMKLAVENRRSKKKGATITRPAQSATHVNGQSEEGYSFTEASYGVEPRFIRARQNASFLSGRYMQTHRALTKQREPVGHAVRWAYMMTAAAMAASIARAAGDESIRWMRDRADDSLRRVFRGKAYVSGGIGSLPRIEGFGHRWELNDHHAYCETCAAIGTAFLAHELSLDSTDPFYADLLEWELYNAASVGIGQDGVSYFYRNPLASDGMIRRERWFATACCPSNLSRLWSSVRRYACSWKQNCLYLDQYVSAKLGFEEPGVSVEIRSSLPWEGDVSIVVANRNPTAVAVALRIPSWATDARLRIDGADQAVRTPGPRRIGVPDFSAARYHTISVPARTTTAVELELSMDIYTIKPFARVAHQRGRVAVCRGPLLFCLESPLDSSPEQMAQVAAPDPVITPESMEYRFNRDTAGGLGTIHAPSRDGAAVQLIPYYAWGNNGVSAMRVWLRSS